MKNINKGKTNFVLGAYDNKFDIFYVQVLLNKK